MTMLGDDHSDIGIITVLGDDGIRRRYNEHYDTIMSIINDPTGAWLAIQEQAKRIEKLELLVSEREAALDRLAEMDSERILGEDDE